MKKILKELNQLKIDWLYNPSIPHRVTKIHNGNRRAFLANAWAKKPLTFELSEQVGKNFEPFN